MPWSLCVGLLVLGVATVSLWGRTFFGGMLMALAFAAAGALRALLPDERAGALAVRSRVLDVLTLWALALAVVVAFVVADLRAR